MNWCNCFASSKPHASTAPWRFVSRQAKSRSSKKPNPSSPVWATTETIEVRPVKPKNNETGDSSTVSELIQHAKENPLTLIVPDIVLEDGVHILHGAEESFKTMLTLQLHEPLTVGGKFLGREVGDGLPTGMVELEMKERLFGQRLYKFFRDDSPTDFFVLPESLRQRVLAGRTAKERVEIIGDWAESLGLKFVSIDSMAKLFPPGFSVDDPSQVTEVFNQIQRLGTVWIIDHDRKSLPGEKPAQGNQEIAGSGRFVYDPDVIYQMVRPDGRAPLTYFHWGKMRDGKKFDPLPLYFDHLDYRLYSLHPYLHLLKQRPMLRAELLAEAGKRYDWKERQADKYVASLKNLVDAGGEPCVADVQRRHSKVFKLTAEPVGVIEPASLAEAAGEEKA